MHHLQRFIHLIFNLSASVTICNLNVRGGRCHLLHVIFSCTKQLIMQLDIANWDFLCYFNV